MKILITGASSGIGEALAKEMIDISSEMILIARNLKSLEKLKAYIEEISNVKVKIISLDLTNESAWQNLDEILSKLEIDIFINNAAIGFSGRFDQMSLEKIEEIINLNIKSFTLGIYFLTKKMKSKSQIVNISSTGAFQAGAYTAVYYASKAYVYSLSLALFNELKDKGIHVLTVCPGATKTNFCKTAQKLETKYSMSSENVAKKIKKAILKRKIILIPGIFNYILVLLSKLMPDILVSKITMKIQKKHVKKHKE